MSKNHGLCLSSQPFPRTHGKLLLTAEESFKNSSWWWHQEPLLGNSLYVKTEQVQALEHAWNSHWILAMDYELGEGHLSGSDLKEQWINVFQHLPPITHVGIFFYQFTRLLDRRIKSQRCRLQTASCSTGVCPTGHMGTSCSEKDT